MRVLMTGATSMIGIALGRELLKQGHEVVAVCRKISADLEALFKQGNLSVVPRTMAEYENFLDVYSEPVDVAVLLAWNGTRGSDRDSLIMQKQNFAYTAALLPQLYDVGCRKFVTAGSQAEYGPWLREEKLTEDVIPHPNTEYGKYKLTLYEYAKAFCAERACTLVEPRFFSLYGENDYDGTLIKMLLRKMQRNEACALTECTQRWDYLHIDDAARGLALLVAGNVPAGVYNFGSGESHELKYYVEKIHQLTKSASPLCYGAVPYPPTGAVNTNPDVGKLMSLGWFPQIPFEAGIRQIIEHEVQLKCRNE